MKNVASVLLLGALGTAGVLFALQVHADTNPVDKAVDATGDAIDTAVEATTDAAETVTESATWDRIAGNWKQLKGSAQARWGELTGDDMDQVEGNKDTLVGKVQEAYGITRTEAEQQVDDWVAEN